jgi:hypothetical protein
MEDRRLGKLESRRGPFSGMHVHFLAGGDTSARVLDPDLNLSGGEI